MQKLSVKKSRNKPRTIYAPGRVGLDRAKLSEKAGSKLRPSEGPYCRNCRRYCCRPSDFVGSLKAEYWPAAGHVYSYSQEMLSIKQTSIACVRLRRKKDITVITSPVVLHVKVPADVLARLVLLESLIMPETGHAILIALPVLLALLLLRGLPRLHIVSSHRLTASVGLIRSAETLVIVGRRGAILRLTRARRSRRLV